MEVGRVGDKLKWLTIIQFMSVLRMNIENYFKNATLLSYIQKKQFM